MDDLITEFIAETQESLSELDGALMMLEDFPDDEQLLGKIFRALHTIKGTSGFLGLPRLGKLAHTAENLLDVFRSGKRLASPADVALILKSLDTIGALTLSIQETGKEPEGDDSALLAALLAAAEGEPAAEKPAAPAVEKKPAKKKAAAKTSAKTPPKETPEPEKPAAKKKATPTKKAAPKNTAQKAAPKKVEIIAESPVPLPSPKAHPAPVPRATTTPAAAASPAPEPTKDNSSQFLRVHVDTLENLMNMVSELVLTRNQLLQYTKEQQNTEWAERLQRLNLIVSELQDNVMKTRMQPVGNAWLRFPRIIHDIAQETGKKIHLHLKGEDTEIDRQVLEIIKDPLMHMVRNSADHGIEMPEDRLASGKQETGNITLSATQEGGYILIRIEDDGKGLDPERIRRKAVERGLVGEAEAANLPDARLLQYIFEPGFSTAETVTAISGRGVGMDVVRTNIERIGGMVTLESTPGKGTCFTIRISLTLAIIAALIVEVEGNRYAVPQANVQEVIRISPDGTNRIETVGDRLVLRLRDTLLPLASMTSLLGKPGTVDKEDCYIVVTHLGTSSFGMMVDGIRDTEEIVVKPLSSLLKSLSLFAGNTILGDGQVVLILDPAGVAKAANATLPHGHAEAAEQAETANEQEEIAIMLLFRAGDTTPKAVPAFLVSRIEEFRNEDIEIVSGKRVIQHRGELMPLHMLADEPLPDRAMHKALVFADGEIGNAFGVIIDGISDIVEANFDINPSTARTGILGSAIIENRATEVLDVNHFSDAKDWVLTDARTSSSHHGQKRKILIVDDSAFFRHMLSPLLNMVGYAVTAVDNPRVALALCDKGAEFDLILSDIEMEGMSGFDFAEHVKAGTRWKDIPMVALSSHASPQDMAMGEAKGFSAYIPKSDKDALLTTLNKVLEQSDKSHGKV